MNRFFSFIGRTAERLTGKKFFATCAYMFIEAFLRVNGVPFQAESLAGLVTFIIGQTAADLKTKKEKIDQILPIAFACGAIGLVSCARVCGAV